MNLRIGDKVICIKSHILASCTPVIKNEEYEIVDISYSKLYRDEEYPIIKTSSLSGTTI